MSGVTAERLAQDARPRSLEELRIWLVAEARLASSLAHICDVELLHPDGWEAATESGPSPNFLLVEAGPDTAAAWRDELDGLLERCTRAPVPSLLWLAGPAGPQWLDRCKRFDRTFSMDRGQLPRLEAAGARRPALLWPAAAPGEPPAREERERPHAVLWQGGRRSDWPVAWRKRLDAVRRGASAHGLHTCRDGERMALRDARVVVAADPRVGSATFAPAVAFDAPLRGAAVVTPHDFASAHDFSVGAARGPGRVDLLPSVGDEDSAAEKIGLLLSDEELRRETVTHLRRIVAHNHTHRHRLATLASAAGYRLAPDGIDPASA